MSSRALEYNDTRSPRYAKRLKFYEQEKLKLPDVYWKYSTEYMPHVRLPAEYHKCPRLTGLEKHIIANIYTLTSLKLIPCPSQQRIAREFGCHPDTVVEAINNLMTIGILRKIAMPGENNAYALAHPRHVFPFIDGEMKRAEEDLTRKTVSHYDIFHFFTAEEFFDLMEDCGFGLKDRGNVEQRKKQYEDFKKRMQSITTPPGDTPPCSVPGGVTPHPPEPSQGVPPYTPPNHTGQYKSIKKEYKKERIEEPEDCDSVPESLSPQSVKDSGERNPGSVMSEEVKSSESVQKSENLLSAQSVTKSGDSLNSEKPRKSPEPSKKDSSSQRAVPRPSAAQAIFEKKDSQENVDKKEAAARKRYALEYQLYDYIMQEAQALSPKIFEGQQKDGAFAVKRLKIVLAHYEFDHYKKLIRWTCQRWTDVIQAQHVKFWKVKDHKFPTFEMLINTFNLGEFNAEMNSMNAMVDADIERDRYYEEFNEKHLSPAMREFKEKMKRRQLEREKQEQLDKTSEQ